MLLCLYLMLVVCFPKANLTYYQRIQPLVSSLTSTDSSLLVRLLMCILHFVICVLMHVCRRAHLKSVTSIFCCAILLYICICLFLLIVVCMYSSYSHSFTFMSSCFVCEQLSLTRCHLCDHWIKLWLEPNGFTCGNRSEANDW